MVYDLISIGASPNCFVRCDGYRIPILVSMIKIGRSSVVEALLQCGAHPNKVYYHDDACSYENRIYKSISVLMHAALFKKKKEIGILLCYGADIAQRQGAGYTTLEYAAPDKEAMELLLEAGAPKNDAVLDFTIEKKYTQITNWLLISHDFKPDLETLCRALEKNESATVGVLLDLKIPEITIHSKWGTYPIVAKAIDNDCVASLEQFLNRGLPINYQVDQRGTTLLQYARRENAVRIMQYLTEHGAH